MRVIRGFKRDGFLQSKVIDIPLSMIFYRRVIVGEHFPVAQTNTRINENYSNGISKQVNPIVSSVQFPGLYNIETVNYVTVI